MEQEFQPSQVYDIHEEYWKYCDDKSVRIVHFYEESLPRALTPKNEDDHFLDNLIDVISDLEKNEKEDLDIKKQPIVLDTPEKIFNHMASVTNEKTV